MAAPRKRVARADFWIDPAFDDRFRREQDIEVEVVAMGAPAASVIESLADAHVYHVHAAKDELPSHFLEEGAGLHFTSEAAARISARVGRSATNSASLRPSHVLPSELRSSARPATRRM